MAAERSYPPALAGNFELPGGKIEPGETASVALNREIAEELGATVVLGEPIPGPDSAARPHTGRGMADHPGSEDFGQGEPGFNPWPILGGRVMWVWLAQVAPDSPAPKAGAGHRQILWVCPAQALLLPWLPANLPIVVDTLARIAKSAEQGRAITIHP